MASYMRYPDGAVLQLFYEVIQHRLSLSGYQWDIPQVFVFRRIEAEPVAALKSLVDEMLSLYQEQMTEHAEKTEFTADNVDFAVNEICSELFRNAIKWVRIVALFTFVTEIAVQCMKNGTPNKIEIFARASAAFVTGSIVPWVEDHGGWAGLIQFMEDRRRQPEEYKWPISFKNLICIGMTAVGAITLGAVLNRS